MAPRSAEGMRIPTGVLPIVLLGCAAVAAAADATKPALPAHDGDKPIAVKVRVDTAQARYRTQLMGDVDHPVGEAIVLHGLSIPTHLEGPEGKQELKLDLKKDGTFKSVGKGVQTIALEDPATKAHLKASIYFEKGGGGAWTYRDVTQLTLQIGPDQVALVDVDGDGTFNEPGVDGMCWLGQSYLFPLPAPDERWCTPSLDLTGFSIGALGENPKVEGRPLATTVPDALGVLQGIEQARSTVGLTPRPENTGLSASLQKHCRYMAANRKLTHPEDAGATGYSADGNESGMNSILSQGSAAPDIAAMMMGTFYHRQDVIRPLTRGFGVGYEGAFGGIDGRRDLSSQKVEWPVLCPVPEQVDVPLRFNPEMPDPIAGDRSAGYPITAYFASGKLKLVKSSLTLVAGPASGGTAAAAAKAPIDCYAFDGTSGGDPTFNGYQCVVGLIAKEPLAEGSTYQAMLQVDAAGTPWTKTWRFTTVGAKAPSR